MVRSPQHCALRPSSIPVSLPPIRFPGSYPMVGSVWAAPPDTAILSSHKKSDSTCSHALCAISGGWKTEPVGSPPRCARRATCGPGGLPPFRIQVHSQARAACCAGSERKNSSEAEGVDAAACRVRRCAGSGRHPAHCSQRAGFNGRSRALVGAASSGFSRAPTDRTPGNTAGHSTGSESTGVHGARRLRLTALPGVPCCDVAG